MSVDEQKFVNAEALKAARKRLDLSQQDVADGIGTNRRAVVIWERSSEDGRNPIQGKNLMLLARVLKIPVDDLTRPPERQDEPQKITAKISPTARYAYDDIQDRHGISRDTLIEAAPLLLEALHNIFLEQRKAQLEALEAQKEPLLALVSGASEEVLVGEREAIERREAFTPSHFGEPSYYDGPLSNRFLDQLLNIPLPTDQVRIDKDSIVPDLPKYVLGGHDLAKRLGVMPDDQPTEDQCKAGYAVVYGHARLNDLPKDLSPPDLVAWLITQIPAEEADGPFTWNLDDPDPYYTLPRRGRPRYF